LIGVPRIGDRASRTIRVPRVVRRRRARAAGNVPPVLDAVPAERIA
jgi:hypothetical protein